MSQSKEIITNSSQPDAWQSLRSFTAARIALGRTGVSVPATETLQFKLAHAHARDAVYSELKKDVLFTSLQTFQLPVFFLESKASDRHIYLQRPDLGRKLDTSSKQKLENFHSKQYDVCITVADGLSAIAVNEHAFAVMKILLPLLQEHKFSIAPLCIVQQARVAIADETASLLKARLSIILIGERPGLSSPDSLGAYITYNPAVGLTDESRNCISNIRPEGLQYEQAANKIFYLINEAFRLQLTGVQLKDNGARKIDNNIRNAHSGM